MTKEKSNPKPALNRRVRIGEWLVPYDDAKTAVRLERKLVDVLTAQPGSDQDCMNSRCIRAQRNAHVFPHPVFIVSTTKSRVFIVDQLDDAGEPAHAVRYQLSERDSKLILQHDRDGVGELGTLYMRPPKDPKGSPHRRAYGGTFAETGSNRRTKTKPTRPVTGGVAGRGAAARYKVAVGGLAMNTKEEEKS